MWTEKQIRAKFDEFNQLYFDNILPQPKTIEFKFVKKYLGQFHWSASYRLYNGEINPNAYSILRMSTAWQMTDFEIEKVIIHEMVHSWQWVVGHSDHHGKWFKRKALEINAKTDWKYSIARKTAIANNTCLKGNKGKSSKCGLIFYTRYNQRYVAICPVKTINKIKNWFPCCYGVENAKFYLANIKNTTIFNYMKKSVTRVHGYRVGDNNKTAIENCIVSAL